MKLAGWAELRDLALSLELPEITEATPWGNPCLKAHGKMWCWWAPQDYANAPAFRMDRAELEFLLEVDPDRFFSTPHHRPHNTILMRPDVFDPVWARRSWIRAWRSYAPKRFLAAWDAANPGHEAATPG